MNHLEWRMLVSCWFILVAPGVWPAAEAAEEPRLSFLKEAKWPPLGGSSVTDVAVVGNLAYVTASSPGASGHFGFHVLDIGEPENVRVLARAAAGINGLAIAHSEGRAYVAAGAEGLKVFDVGDPANVRLLAEARTRGEANALQLVGNRAYVSEGVGGFEIFDISDVTDTNRFVALGHFGLTGTIQDIQVVGNHAYLAAYISGLIMFDVSNPAQIKRLVQKPTRGRSKGIRIAGSLAYVTTTDAALEVFDLSQGTNIVKLASFGTNANASSIALDGNTVYIARGDAGLLVLGLTNQTNVVELPGAVSPWKANRVSIDGARVFLAAGSQGLRVLSRSAPAVLEDAGGYWGAGGGLRVALDGGIVFLLNGEYGLHVLEQNGNQELRRIGGVPVREPSILAAAGGIVGVVDGGNILRVIDARNPSLAHPVSSLVFSNAVRDVKIHRGHVFVSVFESPLLIYDCRDPLNPVQTGEHDFDSSDAAALALSGDRLHLAPNSGSYRILDISDPAHVRLLGQYPWGESGIGGYQACTANETNFVVMDYDGRCEIWDVTDPEAAFVRGILNCQGDFFPWLETRASTDGRLVYANQFYSSNGGVFDLADEQISPAMWREQCIPFPFLFSGMDANQGAIVTCGVDGVRLNPALPGLRTTLEVTTGLNSPLVIEASDDLIDWQVISRHDSPPPKFKVVDWRPEGEFRFYRARQ